MDDLTARSIVTDFKQTEYNRIDNLGEYRQGGPGRPVGSKNKFTLIKEQMAEIWGEADGKKKFKELFKDDFPRALDKLIAIMPKEKEESSTVNNFNVMVIKFDNDKTNSNSGSRVHGIDSSMAT